MHDNGYSHLECEDDRRHARRRAEDLVLDDFKFMRQTIYGKDGLVETLASIEQIVKHIESANKRRNRREWAVIILLLSLVVEVAVGYFTR